jgi:hypothetical protein
MKSKHGAHRQAIGRNGQNAALLGTNWFSLQVKNKILR